LAQVLRDIIGIYSSYPSALLSLYARVKSFSERAFFQLDENRLAFRVPAMRLSVYFLPRETAHLAFRATIPWVDDPYWRKRYSQVPEDEYKNWKEKLLELADKPVTAAEIKKALDIPEAAVKLILNRMAYEGIF
jgi:hypothetical protein